MNEGLAVLARLPFELIVVSNQAGIALGIFTRRDMSDFNAALRTQVNALGGRLDAFYYCPHHEKKDLPPEAATCSCSKPAPGLLFEAADDYELNLSTSFLIGDRETDVIAGHSARCTTVLISDSPTVVTTADFVASSLAEAANWIRKRVESECSN